MKRLMAVVVALVFVVGVSGCVLKSTYKKKETEACNLQADKERLIQERDRLVQEKEALGQSIAKLEGDLSARDKDNAQLKAEKDRLVKEASRINNDLNQLSQKYLQLEVETKELKDSIATKGTTSKQKANKKAERVLK
ncbi:MAG: hypothetical protein WCJ49_01640 [Deltaproteobacteria bacterium]